MRNPYKDEKIGSTVVEHGNNTMEEDEMWSSTCEDSTDDNVGDVATARRGRLNKVIEVDARLDYHM